MLPHVGGQFFITMAFKYALDADLNTGCTTSVFCTVYSIYVAVVFYYCFNQVISCSKIIGMMLIIICIIFLTFDKKEDAIDEVGFTAKEKRMYGGLAIVCSPSAPLLWLIKIYHVRKTIDAKLYSSTKDLAIDSILAFGLMMAVLFLGYVATHDDIIMRTFVEG